MRLGLRIAAIVFLLAQFIRPDRTNPPVDLAMTVQARLDPPAQIQEILSRACNDCHSYETRWPWYAAVAPASWFCVKDVNAGRRHLNLSEWGRYSWSEAAHKLEEIMEEVGEEEMPLRAYLPLHPEARLSAEDRKFLVDWANTARESLLATDVDDDIE